MAAGGRKQDQWRLTQAWNCRVLTTMKLVTDGQLIQSPTSGQIRNAMIVNSLFKLHQTLFEMLSAKAPFPEAAVAALNKGLMAIVSLVGSAIEPLLSSVSWGMERILLSMHKEDFSRPLLSQTPEQMAESSALGDVIPYSLVLQFLFSRGHPPLRPPYQAADWTWERYSRWLDDHPLERDRLNFIGGCLQSYAQRGDFERRKGIHSCLSDNGRTASEGTA